MVDEKKLNDNTIADAVLDGVKVITIGTGCVTLGYLVARMCFGHKARFVRMAQDSAYLRSKIAEAATTGSTEIIWFVKGGKKQKYILKLVEESIK